MTLVNLPGNASIITKVSSDPAGTGVEHSYTFDEDFLLVGFQTQLVTDANAANRQVHFTIEDASGNVYARVTAGGVQAASTTRQYSGLMANFSAPAVADTNFIIPIGTVGIPVVRNGKIKTVTTAIQATDNYGTLQLVGQRY